MGIISLVKNKVIRPLVPRFVFSLYYLSWAAVAAFLYRFPSRSMVIIGVTGTNGKTSTVNAIHAVLQDNGIRAGLISTANYKIGGREWINETKNTTLGRFGLQKRLHDMKKSGCKVVVLEVSSEGIVSHRTVGVDFDTVIFTNLTPEHIEAHGSFEKYKAAKKSLFTNLKKSPRKKIAGIASSALRKTIIANIDDEHAEDFLKSESDEKYGISITKKNSLFASQVMRAEDIVSSDTSLSATIIADSDAYKIHSPLLGKIQIYNILAGVAVARLFGVSSDGIEKSYAHYKGVAGRMERITSKKGFDVIIDYAVTPEALQTLYSTIRALYSGKIIAVFGSCGGGRDVGKRRPMGRTVSGYVDYSILTNEDPYFDDPYDIVRDIELGFIDNGKEKNKDYEILINRDHAIEKALLMVSGKGDVVVVTGKGSETGMNIQGEVVPFNDQKTVLKYLK
ncbi:MAG: UDP-N-acetylmuramoyl-L-alanyl-D-glutamate--2,6-diaminopimelate ligase [Patescibacteria group bacterium]